jgi:hypothetical protein
VTTDAELAAQAGIPIRVLQAIRAVESNGHPSATRFEPHVFRKRTNHAYDAQVPFTPGPHGFSLIADETNRAAFAYAFELDEAAAVQSTSWGSYQVLGSHLLEIESNPAAAVAMFDADPQGVSDRLLVAWFASAPKAAAAARRFDWDELALRFNGRSNAAHYAERLREEAARGPSSEPVAVVVPSKRRRAKT